MLPSARNTDTSAHTAVPMVCSFFWTSLLLLFFIYFLQVYEVSPLDEHNIRLLNNVHPKGWISPEPAPIYNVVVSRPYVTSRWTHLNMAFPYKIRTHTRHIRIHKYIAGCTFSQDLCQKGDWCRCGWPSERGRQRWTWCEGGAGGAAPHGRRLSQCWLCAFEGTYRCSECCMDCARMHIFCPLFLTI